MKLHWFSPLPPEPTDIGNYTARLMPHLAARCDLTVWTTARDVPPEIMSIAPVRHVDQLDWPAINRGDACFYQIGNNPIFHGRIWEIAQRHPGVIVFHDARIHHFIYELCLRAANGDIRYQSLMMRHYGEDGLTTAREIWNGERDINEVVEKYPLAQAVLEGALGAITHTAEASSAARRHCDTLELPLPYPCPGRSARLPRSEPISPGHPARLVVFGHISRNRRLEAVLEALVGLSDGEKDCLRLDIYGELWDRSGIESRIAALGLQEHVALHGFVNEETLDAALLVADLAINLRYPTMGEASGSQLRLWQAGLPSLVTRIGWYATLPQDAVRFVDPETEQEDIRRHLRDLVAQPEAFAKLGHAGFELLRTRHAPGDYAQRIVDFAARLEPDAAGLLRPAMVRRVVELSLPWVRSGIGQDVARVPAAAISDLLP